MPPKARKGSTAAASSGQAATPASSSTEEEPVKVSSLYDAAGLKSALDDCARMVVLDNGYEEDLTTNNVKILLGLTSIGLALLAQFGFGKFPDSWWPVFWCVAAYVVVTLVMNTYLHRMEADSFLICKPRRSAKLGLRLASHMDRFDDTYTLIMSLGLRRHKDYRDVKVSASVAEFFHEDKYLSEPSFRPKVEQLLSEFEAAISKKTQ